MLSENGLQQRHARCWACSRHPSAAAQHSFDVRTALHGSVLSASHQASRRKKKNSDLTFNANTNEQTTHDPSWASCAVPPGYSTTPQDPIPSISHHRRQRSELEFGTYKGYMADQRYGRTVGLDAWWHAPWDAGCHPATSPCFQRRLGPAMYPHSAGTLDMNVS